MWLKMIGGKMEREGELLLGQLKMNR